MSQEEIQSLDDQIALAEQRLKNAQKEVDEQESILKDLQKKREEALGNQPALI